jgi:hypothetical protein
VSPLSTLSATTQTPGGGKLTITSHPRNRGASHTDSAEKAQWSVALRDSLCRKTSEQEHVGIPQSRDGQRLLRCFAWRNLRVDVDSRSNIQTGNALTLVWILSTSEQFITVFNGSPRRLRDCPLLVQCGSRSVGPADSSDVQQLQIWQRPSARSCDAQLIAHVIDVTRHTNNLLGSPVT